MKLLITQFPPTSCHLISLRSKYSPQYPVLTRLHSMFTEVYLREIAKVNVKMARVSASRRHIQAVFHPTSTADGDECSGALLGRFLIDSHAVCGLCENVTALQDTSLLAST
jgi:hypothetical protein